MTMATRNFQPGVRVSTQAKAEKKLNDPSIVTRKKIWEGKSLAKLLKSKLSTRTTSNCNRWRGARVEGSVHSKWVARRTRLRGQWSPIHNAAIAGIAYCKYIS